MDKHMDENIISEALQRMDIPPADDNARKRALNLALAEFNAHQKKNEKNSQGLSILTRLMSVTQFNKGQTTMENRQKKRLVYGGMATAMAVVLIAGVSLNQMQSGIFEAQESSVAAELEAAQLPSAAVDDAAPQATAAGADASVSAMPAPVAPMQPQAANRMEAQSKSAPQRAEAESLSAAPMEAPMQAPMADMAVAGSMAMAPQGLAAAQRSIAPMPPVVMPEPYPPYYQEQGQDKFENFKINPVKIAAEEPVSTFSVDVDTASYSFMRRQIENGQLPAPDSIRVEELINYFDYAYPAPHSKDEPFKASVTVTPSPWAEGKELVHIGIKGYEMNTQRPRSNLVFLLDTSGSMNEADKLPLLKSSFKLLLDTLSPDDTVAIAVYAGSAGTVLEPTKVSDKAKIIAALDGLQAGGGTAGAAGIELAYQLAEQNFNKEAVNRVILATDGDFNVGINDPEALKNFVGKKRDSGVFLSVLGFGQGNYNDHIMQSLAQNGNGVAAYIDNLNEAQKVLVDEATSSLFPIAKDVKIQVEFNPDTVAEYRLIGYETRSLKREDFNNDKVDAGDIGAGHTVTAIYEITPAGSNARSIDPLRYGAQGKAPKTETSVDNASFGGEYAFLKMRYKLPNEDTSHLITTPVPASDTATISDDAQFSLAVAAFGQMLKGADYTGDFTYDDVIALAQKAKGADEYGYRAEFIKLVRLAKSLDNK